jgi:hypothetical protein
MALGIHLKANHATEKVVTTLNHAGMAVSGATADRMVEALNKDAAEKIQGLCKTNTAAVIYDNINFAQRKAEVTLSSETSFVNMTAATFVPLTGASPEALRVTEELWDNNPINPHRKADSAYIDPSYIRLLTTILPDGRSVQEAIREDLVDQIVRILLDTEPGLSDLAKEFADSFTPLHGTSSDPIEILPAETMDHDEGTLDGNASVFSDLRRQGGYTKDQANFITITHCDMASYALARGVQLRRRREKTSLEERALYILPIPGLFHTHGAMGDSVVRVHGPDSDDTDYEGSFFNLSGRARPREIAKLRNKPPYRLVQHLIQMVTVASIRDCWGKELEGTIAAFVKTKPTLAAIREIAYRLHDKYVATEDTSEFHPILANQKLLHRDGLLYMAAHYAIKRGDSGRLENQLVLWIPHFKATGKHSYADNLLQFLTDLRYNWPSELSNIIRSNWLISMNGGETNFMGLDMVQEIFNGMQKNQWSGAGSNKDKKNLKKHSRLVRFLGQTHKVFDSNFNNRKTGNKHKKKDTTSVVADIQAQIKRLKLNDLTRDPKDDGGEGSGKGKKRKRVHGRRMDALAVGSGLLTRISLPKHINGLRAGSRVVLPKSALSEAKTSDMGMNN